MILHDNHNYLNSDRKRPTPVTFGKSLLQINMAVKSTSAHTPWGIWISFQNLTRIHWLVRRIIRKQLDIMPIDHYMQNQGKIMMQSWENGRKPQLGQFFTISRSNISKLQIFLKNRFHSNWKSYLILTSGQKPRNR